MKLLSYLSSIKDTDFKSVPFNDADSVILCQLTYLNLNLIFEDFSKIYDLNTVLNKEENYSSVMVYNTLIPKNNKKLLNLIKQSKRYKDVKIGYSRYILDSETETQFFAVSFIIDNTIFVSYRGTDTTLVGWKEDLNMVLCHEVPSQMHAYKYLKDLLEIEKDKKIILAGHSKGGNLAFFAANKIEDIHLNRIIKIYNLDGPGYKTPEKIFDKERLEYINSITLKVMPHASIVGMLLKSDTKIQFVKARQFYIFQHDLYSWEIDKKTGNFVYINEQYYFSKVQNKAIDETLKNITEDDLKIIFESIYDLLGGRDISLNDIFNNPISHLLAFSRKLRGYSKQKRRKLVMFVKILISQYFKAFKAK